MTRYMEQLTCRFHPEAVLIEDYRAGDMICPMCGLVVGERMVDVSSEWRDFTNDTAPKQTGRVGAAQNPLFDNDNLETITTAGTGAGAVDEFGRQRYGRQPNQRSSADEALRSGNDAIRVMAERLGLTKRITKRAFIIFKQCYEKKLLRGRLQEAMVAACICIACRKEDSAREMKEICGVSNISKKELGRCIKKIIRNLPNPAASQSIQIKDLIPRFCNQLALEQDRLICKTAIHIVERANEICDIQGRAPSSVASAAIYLTCLAACEKITRKDIQKRTDVSEGVIRDVYKILLSHAEQLFPSDFVFKCPIVNLPTK